MRDRWFRRVWLPAARDSLRRRRQMVGSRWWPLRVLLARAVACRAPEPRMSPHGGYGWRCQRHVLHGGAHRFRNYVWYPGGEHAHFATAAALAGDGQPGPPVGSAEEAPDAR